MRNKLTLTSPIACFLPILVIVPILKDLIFNIHPGGISTLYKFFSSAISPSLNHLVLQNALHGIKTTVAIAFIGWIISIVNGLFLGLICSETFYKLFDSPQIIQKSIKRFLAIPRGIHELVWGLLLLQFFGLTVWIAIVAIAIPYSSLMARVFADQIDALDIKPIQAIKTTGAGSLEILITALSPKLLPIIILHGGYRLECALRGATLLGVFGLGGIGTELQLSIQSLQFKEVWTSLWILGIAIFTLEKVILLAQKLIKDKKNINTFLINCFLVISLLLIISISYIGSLDMETSFKFIPLDFPNSNQIYTALTRLDLMRLAIESINIMILASGFAVGMPPLISLLFPEVFSRKIINIIWLICRLIPVPLIALLLLLCINPSISVAALAIGIHNMGVMGKILEETINNSDDSIFLSIKASGGSKRAAWLYGKLSQKSKSYLSYSLYRVDVILRETAVVGIVGGIGLGWQLQESLSSFAWAEVLVVISTFVLLTLLGESISEKLKSSINNDLFRAKAL